MIKSLYFNLKTKFLFNYDIMVDFKNNLNYEESIHNRNKWSRRIYLAEHLLNEGYEVAGLIRRCSVAENQTYRINHICNDIGTYYGDLTDPISIERALEDLILT